MKKKGNIENLTPFPKGTSGNPNGRPKKLPELDDLLDDVLSDKSKGKTEAELILLSLIKEAKKGNVRAAEVLLERAFGKVKQDIGISGEVKTIHVSFKRKNG